MSEGSLGPYEFITSKERAAEVIRDELLGQPVIAIDTETTGLDPHTSKILLVQIATPKKAYVFKRYGVGLKVFKELFEDTSILKLIQNAKFDYKMVKTNAGISIKNIFCTMSAERIINAGYENVRANLEVLAKKYAGVVLNKSVRLGFIDDTVSPAEREFTDKELRYAADDALVLHLIYDAQVQELADRELFEVSILEFDTLPVVADMELNGCVIDREKWLKVIEVVRTRREKSAKEVVALLSKVIKQTSLFGVSVINLDSPTQLLAALHKMDVRHKDGELVKNTNEDYLSEIASDYPIIKKLLEYRGWAKLVNAYGINFLDKIHKKTNRIHADFDQLRAATGRFSSSNPNLQQIPKYDEKDPEIDLRCCFVAPKGYKMVDSDYSQQELRILADASRDPVFSKAYLNNEDRHKQTAADVFEVPLDKVTKEQRTIAKTLNFALIYGAGPGRISQMLNISEDEAKKLLDRYFKIYPKIKGFLDHLASEALKNHWATTVSGRKHYFEMPTPDDPDYKKKISRIKRQAANNFVQGSGADVTKLSLVYVSEAIKSENLDAKILMVVHDEIVIEVKEEQSERMARLLEKCMVRAFSTYFKRIPMVVSAEIADYWCKS